MIVHQRPHRRGQTAIEYLLLFSLVAFVVFMAFAKGGFLEKVRMESEIDFKKVSNVIMGDNPNPIHGGWCPWLSECSTDCETFVQQRACNCPPPAFGGVCKAEAGITDRKECPNFKSCQATCKASKPQVCVTATEPVCDAVVDGHDRDCLKEKCTKKGPVCPPVEVVETKACTVPADCIEAPIKGTWKQIDTWTCDGQVFEIDTDSKEGLSCVQGKCTGLKQGSAGVYCGNAGKKCSIKDGVPECITNNECTIPSRDKSVCCDTCTPLMQYCGDDNKIHTETPCPSSCEGYKTPIGTKEEC